MWRELGAQVTLMAILNFCVKQELLKKCPHVETLRVPKVRYCLPSKREVAAVLEELPARHRLLCRVFVETGCRPGEGYNIKWSTLELGENPQVHFYDESDWSPKTESSFRSVPISHDLASSLNQLTRTADWVFPNTRNDGPMTKLRKALKSACERTAAKLGVDPIKLTPSTFRKCYITWQSERSLDPALIQSIVGHAPGSRVTAQHYKHFSEEAQRDAIYSLPEAVSPGQINPIVAKKVATQVQNPKYTLNYSWSKVLNYGRKIGAGDEIRTHDPNLGKVVLYP